MNRSGRRRRRSSHPTITPADDALRAAIRGAMLRDQPRLRSMLRRLGEGTHPPDAWARVREAIDASVAARAARLARLPTPTFPEDLPVSARRDEIADAVRRHQVVVICGETGSGKTTQLPKICLGLGRGVGGLIGHTQPRRIAARSVAARIAEELGSPLGQAVGYKVRFGDQTSPSTYVKLMTDGILLAETQSDRWLRAYDTLIIDEAHERSLNIDFLLGYLRGVLERRPELKVIITSATIDPQRFANHFAGLGGGGADEPTPVIEVSGRTYPVEVRYRPLRRPPGPGEAADDPTIADAVLEAVAEIESEGPDGDVLIFMPGEREIRMASHALRRRYHNERHTEVLPLYARLSAAEQMRVFRPTPPGARRIVIATNVAETSLTVPGIRYVIDPGTARISRYSARSRVQGLAVEPVSRASADQRKGRCGRIGPGVCIRLYDEGDFLGRDAFTPPEIARTNLASVILQMTHLRMGRPEDFPFVDPPDPRLIRDGYDTLRELGAIDDAHELTPLGRDMARLPIDPRIARIVLAGRDEGCLDAMVIIGAGLSVQDARDRPHEKADAADEAHERFADPDSDFLAMLNVWDFYHAQREKLGRGRLARACEQNFLSERRLREWWDVARQLREMLTDLGLREGRPHASPALGPIARRADGATEDAVRASADAIHRALLAGLLVNVGHRKEGHEYTGVRGGRFAIHPSSCLFEARPAWVMAGELVRTTRLYARMLAKINPAWVESVGAHLVRRRHVEPRWNAGGGRVDCTEKILLGQLEVVPKRTVHYGPINPAESRRLFIWNALVEGDMDTANPAVRRNRAVERRIAMLEEKARRRDLLAEAEARFAFYDRRLPADVYSGSTLDRWWKTAHAATPDILDMRDEDLLIADAGAIDHTLYPDDIELAGCPLALRYRYAPGEDEDGVTLDIPLELLAQVEPERCDQLVPGLLREKIAELIRSLPRSVRRNFDVGPVSQRLADRLAGTDRPLLKALADELSAISGATIRPTTFDPDALPAHLRLRYRVVDGDGAELAAGRDLAAIRERLAGEARDSFDVFFGPRSRTPVNRDGLTAWDFDELPVSVRAESGGRAITGYPALIDRGASVSIRVLASRLDAERETLRGLCRLAVPALRSDMRLRPADITGIESLRLAYAPLGPATELDDLLRMRLCERLFFPSDGSPDGIARAITRHHGEFMAAIDAGWHRLGATVEEVTALFAQILATRQELAARLADPRLPDPWRLAAQDLRDQLASLTPPRFLATVPWLWFRSYPRYLRAGLRRLDRLRAQGPQKDLAHLREVHRWVAAYNERVRAHNEKGLDDPELARFRWLIEEFRVSLFAQELGTAEKVSPRRMEEAMARIA